MNFWIFFFFGSWAGKIKFFSVVFQGHNFSHHRYLCSGSISFFFGDNLLIFLAKVRLIDWFFFWKNCDQKKIWKTSECSNIRFFFSLFIYNYDYVQCSLNRWMIYDHDMISFFYSHDLIFWLSTISTILYLMIVIFPL